MIKDNIVLTSSFKNQTVKAILSIILFIAVYLALIAGALLLTYYCVFFAFKIIAAKAMFITIAVGAGLVSIGILVLIFLFKFMFSKTKVDLSHLVEITEADEPQLFQMIKETVEEVGTRFPKKVYLSADVNASVFYNSNFWSMFFPIRKNLQIGMGLVNSVTKNELKAILAHEFGHFSQRTMKVGSYVYNVNHIIHNMLYDNDGFNSLVSNWSQVSGIISVFVIGAVKIAELIQWILQKVYSVVNKSYMALSREMEFHADEIAANVTGHQPLKHSLMRLDLADTAFNKTLQHYEGRFAENISTDNLYPQQQFVMEYLAQKAGIPSNNGLPQVHLNENSQLGYSKLVIKNQWASHPSIEERVARLESLNLTHQNQDPALGNTLFTDPIAIQKRLTQKLFSHINYSGKINQQNLNSFQTAFKSEMDKEQLPSFYNGYYESKSPIFFDIEKEATHPNAIQLDHLFSNEKVALVNQLVFLTQDSEIIKQIANKTFAIKTFDYDGVKYRRKQANALANKLTQEINNLKEVVLQNDKQIFQYFLQQEKATSQSAQLISKYQSLFKADQSIETYMKMYEEMASSLEFVHHQLPVEQINTLIRDLKSVETRFKNHLELILEDEAIINYLSAKDLQNAKTYITTNLSYFNGISYYEDNLQKMYQALNLYVHLVHHRSIIHKKALLNYQVSLIQK